MENICVYCGLSAPDGNVLCPRKECTITNLTGVLPRGQMLGNIQVGELITWMRTAALYDATINGKRVLLKLSHYDTRADLNNEVGNGAHIRAEAALYAQMYRKHSKKERSSRSKKAMPTPIHQALPVVLSPETGEPDTSSSRLYGKIMYEDRLRYFLLFEHQNGRMLRDMLSDNPQPFFKHSVWLVQQLAEAISKLRSVRNGYAHLAISPDVVFVRVDKEGYWRPTLYDLGAWIGNVEGKPEAIRRLAERFLLPAYTPPEMFEERFDIDRTDVYSLTLMLYQMLMGYTPITYRTRSDAMVIDSVKKGLKQEFYRGDLDKSKEVSQIIETNLSIDPKRREALPAFHQRLSNLYGPMPAEKTTKWYHLTERRRDILLIIGAVVLLVLLAIAFQPDIATLLGG
jgi:serine/threonine protein kinase